MVSPACHGRKLISFSQVLVFESEASAENPQPYPHFWRAPILTVRLSAFDLLCHLDFKLTHGCPGTRSTAFRLSSG
jgi:hypothetical protein